MSEVSRMQLFLEHFLSIVNSMDAADIFDIAIVAFLIYKLIGLVRETRAGQLVKGVVAILFLYLASQVFEFRMLETIITASLTYGVIAILVLFQPELRKILEQVGRTSISSFQVFSGSTEDKEERRQHTQQLIHAVVDGCTALAQTHTGALIVIERKTKIGDIISTGTTINSDARSELVQNIFFHNSPLHDGALIVRDNRLYSAGCFLPLSQNNQISRMLGTRHRAALGMSEVSDSIIVVVSEETGAISVAINGKLELRLSPAALQSLLSNNLMNDNDNAENATTKKRKLFGRIIK